MIKKRLIGLVPESKKYIVAKETLAYGRSLVIILMAVILKALKDSCKDKLVLLVSHRKSTMCIADRIYSVENERMS